MSLGQWPGRRPALASRWRRNVRGSGSLSHMAGRNVASAVPLLISTPSLPTSRLARSSASEPAGIGSMGVRTDTLISDDGYSAGVSAGSPRVGEGRLPGQLGHGDAERLHGGDRADAAVQLTVDLDGDEGAAGLAKRRRQG